MGKRFVLGCWNVRIRFFFFLIIHSTQQTSNPHDRQPTSTKPPASSPSTAPTQLLLDLIHNTLPQTPPQSRRKHAPAAPCLALQLALPAARAGRTPPLFVWTMNEMRVMEWCLRKNLGGEKCIDGVVTDDPRLFSEVCTFIHSSILLRPVEKVQKGNYKRMLCIQSEAWPECVINQPIPTVGPVDTSNCESNPTEI